jgi:zinc protease
MADDRFTQPGFGIPEAVAFPPVTRGTLANGLRLWTIRQDALPLVGATLLLDDAGSAGDPIGQSGLASLTADLADERIGRRDAIAIADAWARLGASFQTDVSPDVTAFSVVGLSRLFEPAIALLADVIVRSEPTDADFTRVRELRLNRLQQLKSSAAAQADRVFLRAVFGAHGYGQTGLGTTTSLERLTLDAARRCRARTFRPDRATLIVAGDVTHDAAMAAAEAHFGAWSAAGDPGVTQAQPPVTWAPSQVWLVDRLGSPQSELRIGHLGVRRAVPDYHAIVTLNAVLGGQFSSRINQRLRQEKGYTYGANTSFDVRRDAGTFACETSVQSDATGPAIGDVIEQCAAIRGSRPAEGDELDRVRDGLTRGYVRHFETAVQLLQAAGQVATHGLPDDTFDCFVPSVLAVDSAAVLRAAETHIHPDRVIAVVVGDADIVSKGLEALGLVVAAATAEF